MLSHSYDLDGCDEVKVIGIYRSQEAAQAAITRLQGQRGFREHPNGFLIDRYELDTDHWVDGFITEGG